LGLTSKKNEALTAEALTAQKRSGWVVARCGIFKKIYIYFFSIFQKYIADPKICKSSLQQFGKPTWHPYNFKKNLPLTVWQTNLAKIETWQNSPPHAHICARIVIVIVVSL
jgi:hypothetical protein